MGNKETRKRVFNITSNYKKGYCIIKKLFPNNKVLPPNKSYDEISKMVNDKMKENDSLSPREVDNELNLPWGTSFEMSGYSDYFESIYEDD